VRETCLCWRGSIPPRRSRRTDRSEHRKRRMTRLEVWPLAAAFTPAGKPCQGRTRTCVLRALIRAALAPMERSWGLALPLPLPMNRSCCGSQTRAPERASARRSGSAVQSVKFLQRILSPAFPMNRWWWVVQALACRGACDRRKPGLPTDRGSWPRGAVPEPWRFRERGGNNASKRHCATGPQRPCPIQVPFDALRE
jgi:hypothetical protein